MNARAATVCMMRVRNEARWIARLYLDDGVGLNDRCPVDPRHPLLSRRPGLEGGVAV
jgi:hypothetical protein